MKKECAICHKDHAQSAMIVDGYYSGIYFHIDCLNSMEGMLWREERTKSDSLYARYLELISHGRVVTCPACHAQCSLYLKSADKPFVWETLCDVCGAVNLDGLSAYRSADERLLLEELKSLEKGFLHSIDASIDARVEVLSLQYGENGRCECGGHFAIAAYPRCATCFTPLIDSYFHYAICS